MNERATDTAETSRTTLTGFRKHHKDNLGRWTVTPLPFRGNMSAGGAQMVENIRMVQIGRNCHQDLGTDFSRWG